MAERAYRLMGERAWCLERGSKQLREQFEHQRVQRSLYGLRANYCEYLRIGDRRLDLGRGLFEFLRYFGHALYQSRVRGFTDPHPKSDRNSYRNSDSNRLLRTAVLSAPGVSKRLLPAIRYQQRLEYADILVFKRKCRSQWSRVYLVLSRTRRNVQPRSKFRLQIPG